ncbi:hypothetical protein PR202_gb22927 [Eleusine coracana subsp. coracana]|uniref:Uncharacterized protein n=1 Tax=Eleusine coracana subsp. coracana TaxID=191504 RepID=A0AAV5FHE2_ELECO|nr:hypothetical protein PR202_gb22927 [Eleusine coracana subsp. coracana]
MAASGPSPHLSSACYSCQIAGKSVPPPSSNAPAVKIRSWRRFAASSSEVSLVPARILRPPPRRRNALREKASQPRRRWLCSTSGHWILIKELEISVGQGASWSGDSKLDMIGDTEEVPLCGTGAGPAFGVYKDPDGNMMQFEVHEDEIMNRNEAAESEGNDDLESISSRARAIAMELESGERVAPNSRDNSSRFHFSSVERMGSSVLNGEVSVSQRNVPSSRSATWTAFAALCGICIVFVGSKLIRSRSNVQLSGKLFDMLRPEMEEDESDKGDLNEFGNGQEFPHGLLRKPLLDRKELMSNIKRAQDSRKWFVLSNSFCHKNIATYDDTSIRKIRTNVAGVYTSEEEIHAKCYTQKKNDIAILKSIDAIEEEISETYGSQSYLDEVSGSESNGTSLSKDKVEESMEQNVDLKNGAPIMNDSERDQGNIGESEVSELTQIDSTNVHKSRPNGASTPSEFERKEQSVEICEKDLDCTQCTEPYVPFHEKHMIYAKDNTHEFSTNVVSEPSEGFSILSSELTKNEIPLNNFVSDFNGIQENEATRTSAKFAHTACCEEFSSHNTSIIGTDACKTTVIGGSMTTTSLQRNAGDLLNLRTQNVPSMQEQEPSISSGSGQQLSHGTENEHKERIIHNETQTRMETDHAEILNNASAPSFFTSQEETGQHTFAEVSTSEKKQGRKKPRAHLPKKKGKLQKEVYNDKEAEKEQSEQGTHGTETAVDPTNHVQKTKGVRKKWQKKVQNEMLTVPAPNDGQGSSNVDQKNTNRLAKKARRKNPKNTLHNQGAKAREEHPETTYAISSPDNAAMDNMKPLDVSDSSVETQI